MLRLLVFGCAMIAWAFAAPPVEAQTLNACADRNVIVDRLGSKYSETSVSMGLANDGSMIEVFASPAGTFTIIVTRPSGVSCIIATGDAWETVPGMKADLKI